VRTPFLGCAECRDPRLRYEAASRQAFSQSYPTLAVVMG